MESIQEMEESIAANPFNRDLFTKVIHQLSDLCDNTDNDDDKALSSGKRYFS